MHFAKASPEGEEGSALRAAGAMHASAHVHAIRYGARGSKPYKSAYSQHVGRFLSCMREFQRAPVQKSIDEARDAEGRWTAEAEVGGYKAGGTTGLTRDQVVQKVRRVLDNAVGYEAGSRTASYTGFIAGKVAAAVAGMGSPPDVTEQLEHHVAQATGLILGKMRSDPRIQKLLVSAIAKAPKLFRKALDVGTQSELKGHVARTMADTCLHPRVACDDQALAAVAHGVYQTLHNQLSEQVASI